VEVGMTCHVESRRVLFVAGSAHPLGGLMTWLDYLLPGLARRGWDPVLGLVEGLRHHRPERLIAEHPHERWIRIPCRTGTPEGRSRALAEALTVQRPAVAVGVNIPDLYPALHHVRRSGCPTRGLMTVHGIEPDLYADALRFREVLDGVAATNRLACRLLEEVSGVQPERVFYAPYGVESTPPGPRSRRPGGRLRIGYAGRLEHSQKRVLDLPRVSNALDRLGIEVEWKVAGSGPAEDGLRRAMPPERTSFLGAVPGHDLPARLYREIDALLVLSSWETGPLVVWEAMAEGIPVVASRYLGSGLEGALRHEENALLFEIGDPEEAARQLSWLSGDTALAERLAAGGRALLRERYDRERSLDAWEHALAAVLELPPRRSATVGPHVPPATGRLERWLGPRWAESTRWLLGRRGPEAGSGGEWPHAYGPGLDPDEFLQRARELDRREEGIACSRL
jgi:glycosyltransferase involved in cell wall biosynthesis